MGDFFGTFLDQAEILRFELWLQPEALRAGSGGISSHSFSHYFLNTFSDFPFYYFFVDFDSILGSKMIPAAGLKLSQIVLAGGWQAPNRQN